MRFLLALLLLPVAGWSMDMGGPGSCERGMTAKAAACHMALGRTAKEVAEWECLYPAPNIKINVKMCLEGADKRALAWQTFFDGLASKKVSATAVGEIGR